MTKSKYSDIISDGGLDPRNIRGRTKEETTPEYSIEQGEVVVTKDPYGNIVAVTRQDQDGRILKVIAESSSNFMADVIVELVANCIAVTISANPDIGTYFDLNLDAKSHLYVFHRDGKWWVDLRYNEQYEVDSISDIRYFANYGMHGRDYINPNWKRYLDKNGH